MGNYLTNEIVYNHIDELWSIELGDMIDYKFINERRCRSIFVIVNNFSKQTWCIHLKSKNGERKTNEYSKKTFNLKTLTTKKRKR